MDPEPTAFRFQYLLSIIFCIFLVSCSSADAPVAQKGILDLTHWDYRSTPTFNLQGDWSFFPNTFQPDPNIEKSPEFRKIPGVWPGTGYALLKLKILLPEKHGRLAIYSKHQATAFEILINGVSAGSSGKPGTSFETSVPDNRPVYYEWDESTKEVDISFKISNFHHRLTGLWFDIRFGDATALYKETLILRDWDLFLSGLFFMSTIYHLGLFFLRRQDRTPLVFALFCFCLFLRIFVTEEKLIQFYFPWVEYPLSMNLEYLTMYAALPLGLHFLRHSFPAYFPRKWMLLFYLISFTFLLSTLFPFPIPSLPVPYFQYVFLGGVAFAIVVLFRAIIHKEQYSLVIGFAILALILAGIFDMLAARQIIFARFIIPIGLFVAILTQTFILSSRYRDLYREKEKLSDRLQRLNETYSRFVPISFLEFLGKGNLEDMRPGDQIKKEMTILFADIRSFTEISESLDSKESFELLNSYISEMEPLIHSNHGFVDKYFGDAIMALFPESSDDAVNAAISMQNRILDYNQRRMDQGNRAIGVGIGIHTGSLMMGLVGSGDRMESTVISDAVHLASKLETLNKYYGSSILISEDTYSKLKSPNTFLLRKLDKLKFRGKAEHRAIYELGDHLTKTEKEAFLKSKSNFERGVELFYYGKYLDSGESFREALRIYSGDRAANLYLKRCTEQIYASNIKVQPGPDLA
ncbi:adenylate/guanylate cyclase domain-containing protein [Leptospira haakeii]|uniref:Adenylate/guanylate cyclase domain-containing protein n=1 Tax=Leptospira haakeii TaxID=2023198 RepID=A0ABX4PNY9_9LEPT|nr:adenylate/guanylate cyclase domain-containing protein [Leptospira haakeii]PKA16586.1 adenylate/guanylate cyclase domain-containing protein [Leptospira haakeii]PKA20607.1 adenylate/guanylate cyclase domain-containing protein [Leptospira haakeii]